MDKGAKLKDVTIFLMIGTALFFDFFQTVVGWIPFVGNVAAMIVSGFAFMTFFLWFYLNGISMITPKRLLAMIGGGIIEMIPYINILPGWTLTVVFLIGTTKVTEFAQKHSRVASMALKTAGYIKSKQTKVPHVPLVDE